MSKTENAEERAKWSELGVRLDCSAFSLPPIDRRSWCFGVIEVKIVNACFCGLRIKRFFEVEKQRKTEETGFSIFCPREKWGERQKWERGRGADGRKHLQTLPALPISLCYLFSWLSPQFSRGQNTEIPVPRSFFAPQPHGSTCYAGYCFCGLFFLCSKIP